MLAECAIGEFKSRLLACVCVLFRVASLKNWVCRPSMSTIGQQLGLKETETWLDTLSRPRRFSHESVQTDQSCSRDEKPDKGQANERVALFMKEGT